MTKIEVVVTLTITTINHIHVPHNALSWLRMIASIEHWMALFQFLI